MPIRSYRDDLLKRLNGADEAASYLTLALEAAIEEMDPSMFLMAVRDVADAQEGIGAFAEATGINRESLYRILSKKGNPTISNLFAILKALPLNLRFDARTLETNARFLILSEYLYAIEPVPPPVAMVSVGGFEISPNLETFSTGNVTVFGKKELGTQLYGVPSYPNPIILGDTPWQAEENLWQQRQQKEKGRRALSKSA